MVSYSSIMVVHIGDIGTDETNIDKKKVFLDVKKRRVEDKEKNKQVYCIIFERKWEQGSKRKSLWDWYKRPSR